MYKIAMQYQASEALFDSRRTKACGSEGWSVMGK